jgi:hypothetical protein
MLTEELFQLIRIDAITEASDLSLKTILAKRGVLLGQVEDVLLGLLRDSFELSPPFHPKHCT